MLDFPTRYSLAFVRRHLPSSRCRILEIGCGDGRLARALLDLGHDIVALDADESAVAAARGRGVEARCVQWPQSGPTDFDAVLFTRSLHHIHPLQEAIDQAWEALVPRGVLLIEDFAYGDAGPEAVAWFAGAARLLAAAGVLKQDESWLRRLADAEDAMPVWNADHDHDLSSIADIEAAVRARFGASTRADAAYFFRYLAGEVAGPVETPVMEAMARSEERLSAAGGVRALGQRITARKP